MARRPGLRVRLAALVAVGATAVLTIAGLALYDDVTSEVSDAITTELDVRLADLEADLDDPAGAAAAQRPVVAQAVDATGAVVVPAGATPILTDAELAGALEGELLVDRPVPGIGDDARVLARRLDEGRGGAVVGVTATSAAPLERVRNRLVLVLLVAGPALTAAVALMGWVLAGAALRPVRWMAQRAETISMTAPGERLPEPPGDDEIAELGRTLNAMLARIEATIAHERGFIDDASNELRTPLAVLRGEIELAAQDDDLRAIRNGLHSALEETDRLTRLSDNLLTLARADAGQLRAGPARVELLDAVRAAVARIPCPDGVTLTVEGEPATVRGEPEWIDRVVANLVINALRHARSQVRVTVDVTTDGVRLSVADDGSGFPDELLPRAFDRFSRGDSARGPGGIGLGLAIVASIMRALGGTARAGNGPPLGGARVEATFPDQGTWAALIGVSRTRRQAWLVIPPTPPAQPVRQVLIVEDDQKLAAVLARSLQRAGYSCVTAESGDQALWAVNARQPDALVVDVMIPHPSGVEVCRHLRNSGFDGPVVVISARSNADDRAAAQRAGADRFLAKPFALAELVATVGSLIEARATS